MGLQRMPRGRTLVLALVCVIVGAVPFEARATRPEACFAINPALPVVASTCTYVATVNGGIDALNVQGSWVVTIKRVVVVHGHRPKTTTIVIRSNALPPRCVSTGPRTICPIGTILPGDHVSAAAREPLSFVGVGNPCPVSNPGLPPPILGGRC